MKSFLRTSWKKWRHRRTRLRSWWWSQLCAGYGVDTHIRGRITVFAPERLHIGSHTSINEGVVLNARGGLSIGSQVHVSVGVSINTIGLQYAKRAAERTHTMAPVNIADGVWIGAGAIINPGVTVGEHAVIGAGSVVTKDVPANTVAVGVPAKVIKEIN